MEVLENNPPKGKFHLLVVGTFNGDIEGNEADWFYGRSENMFWYLFPKTLGHASLHAKDNIEKKDNLAADWKAYCSANKIIVVDILKSVFKELPNHSDSELSHLSDTEFDAFDFEKAFADTEFDGILFTWKGVGNNMLTQMKNKYISFFKQKGTQAMHMVTPSNAYWRLSKEAKLEEWQKQYSKLK